MQRVHEDLDTTACRWLLARQRVFTKKHIQTIIPIRVGEVEIEYFVIVIKSRMSFGKEIQQSRERSRSISWATSVSHDPRSTAHVFCLICPVVGVESLGDALKCYSNQILRVQRVGATGSEPAILVMPVSSRTIFLDGIRKRFTTGDSRWTGKCLPLNYETAAWQ